MSALAVFGIVALSAAVVLIALTLVLSHLDGKRTDNHAQQLRVIEAKAASMMVERDLEEAKALNRWYGSTEAVRDYQLDYARKHWLATEFPKAVLS